MKKKTKGKLIGYIFFLVIVIAALATSYFLDFSDNINIQGNKDVNTIVDVSKNNDVSTSMVEPKLQIHYIDVGQADAILIKQNEHFMLIDAGKNDTEESLLNYLRELGVSKFDYIIGTHVHEDHIGGMDKVIENFDVENIFFPKQTSTTKTFENFAKAVQAKNKKLYAPSSKETFTLGEASFEILAPNSSEYKEANDYSIVVKLKYKNKSFLFMGDAEEVSEKEILDNNLDVKADVLKIGHHGSKTSTSTEFLEKVDPSLAVISVGKDNSYKHPSKETMVRLQASSIPVYRTDESGTIILNCDGDKISLNVEEGSYEYGK